MKKSIWKLFENSCHMEIATSSSNSKISSMSTDMIWSVSPLSSNACMINLFTISRSFQLSAPCYFDLFEHGSGRIRGWSPLGWGEIPFVCYMSERKYPVNLTTENMLITCLEFKPFSHMEQVPQKQKFWRNFAASHKSWRVC